MESTQNVNYLMENTYKSESKSTKKKLRFFSKSSKKRESKVEMDYQSSKQCYCEECLRSAVNQNHYQQSQQQLNSYYYPNESQMSRTQSSGADQQRMVLPEEHMYAEVSDPSHQYVERIYPPPQQYPCECTNCLKKRGDELTTELLPLDTQIPLQMMSDSAVLCTIL